MFSRLFLRIPYCCTRVGYFCHTLRLEENQVGVPMLSVDEGGNLPPSFVPFLPDDPFSRSFVQAVVTIRNCRFGLGDRKHDVDRCEQYLTTSDNQFGFKSNLGTDKCIYVLREVIDYFKSRSSPVYLCYLDC